MTDHEQIRRDAELELSANSAQIHRSSAQLLARHCLALLAEMANVPALMEAAHTVLDESYTPEQGPARRQLREALAAREHNQPHRQTGRVPTPPPSPEYPKEPGYERPRKR
jgi:hypothetical protein